MSQGPAATACETGPRQISVSKAVLINRCIGVDPLVREGQSKRGPAGFHGGARIASVRNPAAARSSGCPTWMAHARRGLFRPRCGRPCGRRESPPRERGCNRQSSKRNRRAPRASCRLWGISISILSKAFIPVVNSRSVPSSFGSMRKSIQRCRGRFSARGVAGFFQEDAADREPACRRPNRCLRRRRGPRRPP